MANENYIKIDNDPIKVQKMLQRSGDVEANTKELSDITIDKVNRVFSINFAEEGINAKCLKIYPQTDGSILVEWEENTGSV